MKKKQNKCKICKGYPKLWYKKLFDDRHGYPGYFNVLKCQKCGFGQTAPQIKAKKISELYEKYYPRRNIQVSSIKLSDYNEENKHALWRKGLMTNCEYSVPGNNSYKVLDVGSGVGYSLLWLKNMGHKPYGIEPDITGKKVAEKYKIPFHYGFIEDQPFKGEKFDYVIASQVLEHTNDPKRFLLECKKRLKPEGSIILSFPNANSLTRQLLGRKWLHWHIPYHLNHFSRESIQKLAGATKLEIESIKTVTPNMWTNIQVKALLTKPKMGKRDTFWDGGGSTQLKSSYLNNLFSKTLVIAEDYNYINRLVDSIGLGESFLVVFTKG